MSIKNLKIETHGYIHCKSSRYSAHATLSNDKVYEFTKGVNRLEDEIDSDVWAISYYVSMYDHKPEDFIMFGTSNIMINDQASSMEELSRISCYMDLSYPLFSNEKTVRELITEGIKNQDSGISADDVKEIFCLDAQRFERTLNGVGNEIFRAMAAIGYSHGKQIFCFPWFSKKCFEGYHRNITWLLEKLDKQNKIVILPINP